jgi:methylglutaconyl-CoA hydratase
MTHHEFRHLTVRREGAVERVTLARPEVRNAFNEQLVSDLTAWARSITADSGVRVAVLAGQGKAFCAGADLDWLSRVANASPEENRRDADTLAAMLEAVDRVPCALIGRIHGAAIAGGAGLAALCDIAVAADDAVFGFTEVKLGIVPAVISPYVLAKIGRSAAAELFLTGARFPASHARDIGLVHACVPASVLDETIEAYIRELLTSGPEAVAAAKVLIRQVAGRPPADARSITTETIAARRASAEAQEGMHAFLQKRQPRWSVEQ